MGRPARLEGRRLMVPEVQTVTTSTYVSPHLLWSEIASKDALRTPVPVDLRYRAGLVAVEFEMIRAECCRMAGRDVPLVVKSGYRTPEHNRAVNGAERSQHLYMRALDIACPELLTWEQFQACCRAAAHTPSSRIRRLIWYPPDVTRPRPRVHMDIRSSDVFKEWSV